MGFLFLREFEMGFAIYDLALNPFPSTATAAAIPPLPPLPASASSFSSLPGCQIFFSAARWLTRWKDESRREPILVVDSWCLILDKKVF